MMQIIEQIYTPPPIVPFRVPKEEGFHFLPPGTIAKHVVTKWGLYYYPAANVSYMVYDQGKHWQITHIPGKVRISHAQGVAATKPCCRED